MDYVLTYRGSMDGWHGDEHLVDSDADTEYEEDPEDYEDEDFN